MPRPHRTVVEARPAEFLLALRRTGSRAKAAAESGISPQRVLRLLDERPEFRQAVHAILEDKAA